MHKIEDTFPLENNRAWSNYKFNGKKSNYKIHTCTRIYTECVYPWCERESGYALGITITTHWNSCLYREIPGAIILQASLWSPFYSRSYKENQIVFKVCNSESNMVLRRDLIQCGDRWVIEDTWTRHLSGTSPDEDMAECPAMLHIPFASWNAYPNYMKQIWFPASFGCWDAVEKDVKVKIINPGVN